MRKVASSHLHIAQALLLQAVGVTKEAGVQATCQPSRNGCSQYEPPTLSSDEKSALLESEGFAEFMAHTERRYDMLSKLQ